MKRGLSKPSIALGLMLGLFVAFHLVEYFVMPVDFNSKRMLVFHLVWWPLLIIAIVWLAVGDWKVEAARWQREKAVAAKWAHQAGFRFADVPLRSRPDLEFVEPGGLPEGLRRLRFFHDWPDSSVLSIAWMTERITQTGEILLFRYVVGDVDGPEISNLAMAFHDERLSLPEFVLDLRLPMDNPPLDRPPWSWVAGRVPRKRQVPWKGRPAFMERFVLYGPDPAAIEPLFTKELLDFFESECMVGDPPAGYSLQARRRWHARAWANTWCVEGNDGWLLAYRPTVDERKFEPLRPGDIDSLLEAATRVFLVFAKTERKAGNT
ncbi:MAG: hypothetical protein H8E44_09945 [Planctomycetes bacterium]|nr:hypothetical protein [Planctomycetota bacterium]MBL7041970.1 hypothetical protein [Pirellulaceae bacterium]